MFTLQDLEELDLFDPMTRTFVMPYGGNAVFRVTPDVARFVIDNPVASLDWIRRKIPQEQQRLVERQYRLVALNRDFDTLTSKNVLIPGSPVYNQKQDLLDEKARLDRVRNELETEMNKPECQHLVKSHQKTLERLEIQYRGLMAQLDSIASTTIDAFQYESEFQNMKCAIQDQEWIVENMIHNVGNLESSIQNFEVRLLFLRNWVEAQDRQLAQQQEEMRRLERQRQRFLRMDEQREQRVPPPIHLDNINNINNDIYNYIVPYNNDVNINPLIQYIDRNGVEIPFDHIVNRNGGNNNNDIVNNNNIQFVNDQRAFDVQARRRGLDQIEFVPRTTRARPTQNVCTACMEHSDLLLSCTGTTPHHLCSTDLVEYIRSQLSDHGSRMRGTSLCCMDPLCDSAPFADHVIFGLLSSHANHTSMFLRLKEQAFEKMYSEAQQAVTTTKASMSMVNRHVSHICDNILTLHCPCGLAFADYSGCAAVECINKHHFCAACLDYLSSDSQKVHDHVMHCRNNPDPDRYGYYIPTGLIAKYHNDIRKTNLDAYLSSLTDPTMKSAVISKIEPQVKELGITI